jgi:enoyl-CoA hydratase
MNDIAAAEPSVIATRQGRVGHILLNRPRTLNALDIAMIRTIAGALNAWRDDPAVHGVVIEGAGERAFCAGGDIRAVRDSAVAGDRSAIAAFFTEEYGLNALIAEYPKPYIALITSLCLGGGIGISVHGRIRVTTEGGLFAMPETAIGMFPDVGTSFMLPRLPGTLGMYLGLTGTRLAGADAVHAGIATHFVPGEALPALRDRIFSDGPAAVATYARTLPPFSLAPYREAIDRCFSAPDVAGIIAALQAERTDWARATLAALLSMSPSAVLWSFEIIRRGAGRGLRECLAAELELTGRVTAHPDFVEGVRAMVVDKDRQPQWTPMRIEDVDLAAIGRMFAA